uniref:GFA family protein n=1 Tax=Altererythrobacter segetis TaxID=1104773 RepID=UPI00140B3A91|nr:GFA family protein [Altererythrobacter segetis]
MANETAALEGHCACGEVRYRLADRPFAVHCCHCRDCQRETGSAFVINGLIETPMVEVIAGSPEMIGTPSASGKGQQIVRCPTCHVALWSHYGGMGEKAAFVRVGTLENPDACPPHVHIFTGSKQPWFELSMDAPAYDVFYSRDDLDTLFGPDGAARWRALRGG